MKNFQLCKGQSLIELLLAIALSAVLLPALLTGFVASREGKAQHGQRTEAVALLKATTEAVRSVREEWSSFANNGTFHPEISVSGSSWTLVPGQDTTPSGFTRKVEISNVNRGDCPGVDCRKIVTTGGTIDPSTKKVVVTVSWEAPYLSSITSTLYLARYLGNNAFTETLKAEFDLGTGNGVEVTNTSGGEVILGPGSYGNWCGPSLSYPLDLPKSGVANAISATEGIAYAGTGDNASGASFAKVNIGNNPPNPSIEASFEPTPPIKTNGVFGETNYAYLATDTNSKEVVIIDLNNIVGGRYQEVGFFDAPGNGSAESVFVSNDIGYMTDAANKLYAFDLRPASGGRSGSRPQLGPEVLLAGIGREVFINGNYAYVAIDSTIKQLQIINVVDPSSMSVVGQASVGNVSALDFDGTNDKATIPDSPSLRPLNGLTVAAWIKPDVLSGVKAVVDKRRSGSADSYVLTTTGTQARFCASETDTQCANGGTLTTGVWQLLTGTYDGATIRTYINGVQVATRAWSNPLTYSTFPVLIGSEDQAGTLTFYFNGMIDEVRIYDRAMAPAEILTIYSQGVFARLGGSFNQGLVGYWNLDEAGQIVGDSSSNNNNGTLGATSAVASDDPAWIAVDAGNKGGADVVVSLTGDRTYLAIGQSATNREFFIIDTSTKTGNRPILGTYDANGMDPKGVAVVTNNKAIVVGQGSEEYQVIDTLSETNPVRCGGIQVDLGIRDIASVTEGDGDAYSYIVTGDVNSEFKIVKGGAGGVYITSGTFESNTFDAGSSTAFNRFDASVNRPTNTNPVTNVEFQVAIKPGVGGSCASVTFSPTDFVGPSGTSSDKFQTTTTSGVQIFSYVVPFAINSGQCFRYKTYLSTTDFFATPFFYDITVNYSL